MTLFQLIANVTSDSWTYDIFSKINDTFTVNNASYYGAEFSTPDTQGKSIHVGFFAV